MHRSETPWPARAAGDGPAVSLVVGAGGSGTAAAVGAFRSLQRAGIAVRSIIGSSSGGVVAAALALGWDADTIEAVLRRLWLPVAAPGARHRAALRMALPHASDGARSAFALTDGSTVEERVRRAFGDATFGDAHIPLRIVVTDLVSGERLVLDDGPVGAAVRASLTVPLLLPPVALGSRSLVDGALSDPLPILQAVADGGEAVVAVAFPCKAPARAGPVVGAVLAAHAAASNNLLRLAAAYQELAVAAQVVRLEPPFGGPAALFDAGGVADAIARGDEAMEAEIEALLRLMA